MLKIYLFFIFYFSLSQIYGTIYIVSNNADSGPGSLREAVAAASDNDLITFNDGILPITLTSGPLVISSSFTIDGKTSGGNITISGGGTVRPFMINSGSAIISNLTIADGAAIGGQGGGSAKGGGGGGGAGLGGACFADANITLVNVIFANNMAQGGDGGSINNTRDFGGGGGGGLGGNGGSATTNGVIGGGGGGQFPQDIGIDGGVNRGIGIGGGGDGGVAASVGNPGGRFGGGGGGGGVRAPPSPPGPANKGGDGGYAGGGGGEGDSSSTTEGGGAGQGGFGGGGGGTSADSIAHRGVSVFGGGAGGFLSQTEGSPGGGGAGLGGAIFASNQSITTLKITDGVMSFTGNTVNPGDAGSGGLLNWPATAGQSLGSDIFIEGGSTLAFDLSSGVTFQMPTSIESNRDGLQSIIKNVGPGTLDLSATSQGFKADIYLNSGMIHIASDGNLGGSGSKLIFNGGILKTTGTFASNRIATLNEAGAVIQTDSGVWTLSGVVEGVGALVKTGDGTLCLSNTNTYAGGTVINRGVLAISSADNIGGSSRGFSLGGGSLHVTGNVVTSGDVSVIENATINTDSSMSMILSGKITGSNSKILTLSGVGINSLSEIAVNNSDVFTVSGVVGGSQTLIKSGTGTLLLTGANLYSGGTAIREGILSVSSEDNIGGRFAGLSLEGGTLHVTGNLSISGAVSVRENSTINTDSSISTVLSGALTGSNGKTLTLSGSGNHFLSEIIVNDSDMFTIAGALKGSGVITKRGSGILNIVEHCPCLTAPITVYAGELKVNGSIHNSSSIVNSGATVTGTGTFGRLRINSGAKIIPGNSIGTMNVGSIVFDPGSIFQIEINPTDASRLNISGLATLAGNVKVKQDPGSYADEGQYLILQASSISGAFNSEVTGGFDGYIFSLNQIGNNIYLLYKFGGIASAPILIPTTEASGLYGNALKIANHLNHNANISTISLLKDFKEEELQSALSSVSPARNAFGTYVTEQTVFSLSSFLTNHVYNSKITREESSKKSFISNLLVDASDKIATKKNEELGDKFSGWISGFAEFSHQKAKSQNPSFNFISEAVVTGFDYHGKQKSLAGGALGYAHTRFYDKENSGHGNIDYYFGSVYSDVSVDRVCISSAVWGVFNQIENTRKISFTGFSQTAKADIFAWQLIPHIELSYEYKCGWGGFAPFISADWAISWQRKYTEKGASPFDISQQANNSSMVRSETGIKFYEKWQRKWGAFFLKEKITYVFEKPFGVGTVNAAFAGVPNSFTVSSVNHNLNLVAIGLNFLAGFGKSQSLILDFSYSGEIGNSYWSNDLTISLTKHF